MLSRSWEFLFMGRFRDTHFVLQESTKLQSKQFGGQKTCTELCGTVDVRFTVSFATFFPVTQNVNNLGKEQKNARFLAV